MGFDLKNTILFVKIKLDECWLIAGYETFYVVKIKSQNTLQKRVKIYIKAYENEKTI